MATRLNVSFVLSDYGIYDNTTPNAIALTSLQSALAVSALLLLLNRSAWNDLSDSEWDQLNSALADMIGIVQDAI